MMTCYRLYIVLEGSKDPARTHLNYGGCVWGGPGMWNVHSVLGRGGASLSVLSASVSAVLRYMNLHTALTGSSSSAENGNDRFLSGEPGGGRLGPGRKVRLEVATGDWWLCCPASVAVLAPSSVKLSGVRRVALASVP